MERHTRELLRRPRASLFASWFAQKCMKISRGYSVSMWRQINTQMINPAAKVAESDLGFELQATRSWAPD